MLAALACAALSVLGPANVATDQDPEPARYVRVSLPFQGPPLSLAEVEVFSGGVSIAVGKPAKQSNTSNEAGAERAVDGVADGDFTKGSVTHTIDGQPAWWEVDLGAEVPIDRVVVWNRTDCCGERLQGFTLELFDKRRKPLWKRVRIPAPAPSVELVPFTPQPAPPPGPSVEQRNRFQPKIDQAIDDGIDFLISQQLWDGSYAQQIETYPVGAAGLALYTFLKSNVPQDHPAVQRGVAYILASEPRETYELGTLLMGMGALPEPRDPEVERFMQRSLDLLLDHQGAKSNDGRKEALWAYPNHADIVDLSNSQYAALGLRAAAKAGLDVPDRVWKKMAEATLRYQEEPRRVPDLLTEEGSTTGEMQIAGFPYRAGDQPPTASMTTAGLGILGICREALGEGSSTSRKLRPAIRRGVGWLAHNFSVRANPGGGQNWLLYYLYGLERVGALHGLERIGSNDWYWEGARAIVGDQGGNGSWTSSNVADTCFAILFLSRATASATSGEAQGSPEDAWASESPDLDVSWRILGGSEVTLFVTGFSELAQEELATGLESGPAGSLGLHVLQVEYLVDGEVVASVPGDAERRWKGERYPARHSFERAGLHRCQVRVTVASPEVGDDGSSTDLLLGEELEVQVRSVPNPLLLDYPDQAARNLLRGATATASSSNGSGHDAKWAVDGTLAKAWVAAKDDAGPSLTIELEDPAKGRVLMIAHPNNCELARGRYDRATRLRVTLHGRKEHTFELDMPELDEEKLVLELEKPLALRSIRIEVLERTTGKEQPGRVGLGEVQWLPEP